MFFGGLGTLYMKHYDPLLHTTADVVRAAIIPLSAPKKSSLAEVMMNGEMYRMHAWEAVKPPRYSGVGGG